MYDATPASPAGAPPSRAQTLCADVLIVPFNNIKGAGVVALLNEGAGKKGLALVIHEAGNTDTLFLAAMDGDPAQEGEDDDIEERRTRVPSEGGIAGRAGIV